MPSTKTSKKRRRKGFRLRKSIRQGCMVFILAALAFAGFLYFHYNPVQLFSNKTEDAPLILPPDSVDDEITERIQKVAKHTLRIDTAKTAISILDLERRCIIYEQNSHRMMPPASCMKLLTAISAMHRHGVDHCYRNRIMTDGTLSNGSLQGDIILELDDDPLVEAMTPYAQAIKKHGITEINGNIVLGLMRTDTLRQHPTAAPWDIPYRKVPLLMKGCERVKAELRFALEAEGIKYHQMLVESGHDGEVIYEEQHPMREVINPMLIHSSNVKAECVFYHTYHVEDMQGEDELNTAYTPQSFIFDELGDTLYERYVINDGSGLSPKNRLTSDFLVRLVQYAFDRDDMREALISEALATPGDPIRHGSLLGRMANSVCKGRLFCKTGTLTTIGASSLTGYAQNENGRWFAFSIINEDTPVYEARDFQDALCKALIKQAGQ